MRRLKIGIVIDQLLEGGVQRAAIQEVRSLKKRGHEVTLIILMRKSYDQDFSYLVQGIPHFYLSDLYPRFLRNTYTFPIFHFFSSLHVLGPMLAPFFIRKNQFDILVSIGTTTCLTTQTISMFRRIPYIALIPDLIEYILDTCYSNTILRRFFFILKPLARRIEKSFIEVAANVVIISPFHAPYFKKHYQITPQVITFGTTPQKELPMRSDRSRTALTFGRWQKEKHPEFLIALMKSIPEISLIIAGKWTREKDLSDFREQVQKEKLCSRISIIPHFTHKSLTLLSKKAFVWIYPHIEAFGLSALEAAGLGLPLIMPQKSGAAQLFAHGVEGFFLKTPQVNAYKKYILHLLNDAPLRKKMGTAAWNKVKKHYSWQAHGREMEKLLYNSLQIPKKPKFLVFELGHALGAYLSGGDKVFKPMAMRLLDKYDFSIMVPHIAKKHWSDTDPQIQIHSVPHNRFDNQGSPIPVFLTYCIRMLYASMHTLRNKKNYTVLYSSTDILPDNLPAFVAKLFRPSLLWITRVHHLVPVPHQRQGIFVVNVVSYLMQRISLFLMKHIADHVFALNEELKKKLLKQGFNSHKLTVLGAGVDFKKIHTYLKQATSRAHFDAIYVGRLHPAKGIFDLVPIWKKVVAIIPGAKLVIIGGGSADIKQLLSAQIKTHGLTRSIRMLGYISDQKLYSTLASSKVFLFTDHESGWGLAAAEALVAGVPIVGYDIGILGDVYKTGFIKVPLANTEEFATAVLRLLNNEKQRKSLVASARSTVGAFDWDTTTSKFAHVVHTLLNNRGC